MVRGLKIKLVRNSNNGQIHINLPKKQIPKEFLNKDVKFVKVKLEEWFE